jgi:general stress protein YciG
MQQDMTFSQIMQLLQKHTEQIKRLVEELRGIRNALVETELDDIESEGDDEGNEEGQSQGNNQRWGRQRRGFAAMDPGKRSEIARKGGQASRGGQGQGRDPGQEQLEAMEQFLEERGDSLNDKGRREVEQAIEKKRAELENRVH